MSQRFVITLTLITDCEEIVDEDKVAEWLPLLFSNCDMGQIEIDCVEEKK